MIRTQIQLTAEQAERLRQLAGERGVSVAALVREGVDRLLAEQAPVSREERRQRIMSVAGKYASGRSDVSAKHDEYFADSARPR